MAARTRRWWLWTALCVALAACPAPDDDDDSAGDDDDSVAGDDDDSAEPAGITAVTFAASIHGELTDWSPEAATTVLEGTFHLLYWNDLDAVDVACRQRVAFEGRIRFGEAMTTPCEECLGRLRIESAHLLPPDEYEDGCTDLDEAIDLSFLAAPKDVAEPADFRSLHLVPALDALEAGAAVGADGLLAADVLDRYAAAGYEVLHVATIRPDGWLEDEARLGDVAARWPDGLPMFVVYADGGVVGDLNLEGDSYLSTLWTVRVGAGLSADAY